MHFPEEGYVADHSAWVGSLGCSSLLAGRRLCRSGPGAADASDGSLRPRARARPGERRQGVLSRPARSMPMEEAR